MKKSTLQKFLGSALLAVLLYACSGAEESLSTKVSVNRFSYDPAQDADASADVGGGAMQDEILDTDGEVAGSGQGGGAQAVVPEGAAELLFSRDFSKIESMEHFPGCARPQGVYLRTIYVDSVDGRDDGDGSASSPFKNIQVALDGKLIRPGDRVIFRKGFHGKFFLNNYKHAYLKDSTQWISFEGEDGAVIMGGIALRGIPYLRVANLTIKGSKIGLLEFSDSSYGEFVNNMLEAYSNSSSWLAADWLNAPNGLSTRGGLCVLFKGNTIRNVRFGVNIASKYSAAIGNKIHGFSADGVRATADYIMIRNNEIKDSYLSSADGDANHDDGIQFFPMPPSTGTLSNILITGNTIIENTIGSSRSWRAGMQGIGAFDGFMNNIVVRKNLIVVSAYHGIGLLGVEHSRIEQNTVIDIAGANRTWIGLFNSKTGRPSKDVVVRNNLATKFTTPKDTATLTIENNFKGFDPVQHFRVFQPESGVFDMRLKNDSEFYGKGLGYE